MLIVRPMSLNNDIKITRQWMYIDGASNKVSETYCQELEMFRKFAKSQQKLDFTAMQYEDSDPVVILIHSTLRH